MGQRVTLQTIADAVGVSRATVSNAYNRPGRLSAELRARILAAADEHGYAGPDPVARRLRTGRGGTVGVLFTEPLDYAFSDPGCVEFLAGFSAGVRPVTTNLVLIAAPPGAQVADAIRGAAADAVCVYSMPEHHEGVATVLGLAVPVVVVDMPAGTGRAFVGIDDRRGGVLVGEHLVALGHRRIGVLTSRLRADDRVGAVGPDRLARASFRLFRERIAGLREALTGAGITWADVALQERRNTTAEGAAGAAALLSAQPRPTAIVALTDQLALGALAACRAAGLDVPGQVSVTGFDDIAAARTAQPPLTTVAQPTYLKGREAGQALLAALDAEPDLPPATTVLPVELVVRGSTAPPS